MRNRYQLENIRIKRQHYLRKDCTTHENFVTMYDYVYGTMVYAKLAAPLEK